MVHGECGSREESVFTDNPRFCVSHFLRAHQAGAPVKCSTSGTRGIAKSTEVLVNVRRYIFIILTGQTLPPFKPVELVPLFTTRLKVQS